MITKFHGSLLMTFLDLQEKREGHRIGKENKYFCFCCCSSCFSVSFIQFPCIQFATSETRRGLGPNTKYSGNQFITKKWSIT